MGVLKSIGAVLAGYAVIVCLVIATNSFLHWVLVRGYRLAYEQPARLLIFTMTTAALCSVLGGYVTARLAPSAPGRHVLGLLVFGECIGIASVVMFWGRQPLWYAAGLLILYPAAVLAGGRLAARR